MEQEIRNKLFEMQDLKYKEFHSSLSPNVDNIIGVRVPKVRQYAKELYKNNELEDIKIGDKYCEELMLQGFIIGLQTKEPIEKVISKIDEFVPKINSWAVCDTFCSSLKITKKYPKEIFNLIEKYLKSKKEYEIRFSIVMLLDYYINDEYIDKVLEILENIKSYKYYVQMANAWAISVALVKYYEKTIKFLENCNLDKFTYNKAIQKAIESYRITNEQKEYLRNLKVK
ncbi:MAG: DNA alkylation repair protein [Clostridia bacterium]|nr:DNA alkylation repair protein [Clostridia bacterium]